MIDHIKGDKIKSIWCSLSCSSYNAMWQSTNKPMYSLVTNCTARWKSIKRREAWKNSTNTDMSSPWKEEEKLQSQTCKSKIILGNDTRVLMCSIHEVSEKCLKVTMQKMDFQGFTQNFKGKILCQGLSCLHRAQWLLRHRESPTRGKVNTFFDPRSTSIKYDEQSGQKDTAQHLL